jgi:branched-chain amino acid transport system ATP-binding protein
MLEVEGLESGYGRARILENVGLYVRAGEVVVLLGRNGAGKSTTLKSVMGLVRPRAGRISFRGRRIDGLEPFEICRLGLGYVPEDRRIFTDLTVLENLEIGQREPRFGLTPWTKTRLFKLFPNLQEMQNRFGGQISGGEQRMLSLARTLMGNPYAILLDEPSEGLAPAIVADLASIVRQIKSEGLAVLLSEQNLRFATRVSDRAYVIERGRIRYQGTMTALAADVAVRDSYLAV